MLAGYKLSGTPVTLEKFLAELREGSGISQKALAKMTNELPQFIEAHDSGDIPHTLTSFLSYTLALDRDPVLVLWALMESKEGNTRDLLP